MDQIDSVSATMAQVSDNLEGNEFYTVRPILGKGKGCIASKPIPRGTRILSEPPLLYVPIGSYLKADIEREFENLSPGKQALYYTLHSGHAQDPRHWPSKIHPSVTGHERQRITDQHEARISQEASLISIFQVNCMALGCGAAVFARAARFNHCCNPSACYTWNEALGHETVHTTRNIEAGEEITLSYCDTTNDKRLRAWDFKHYGFTCECAACGDVDDESSFAHKSEVRRYRLRELEQETRESRVGGGGQNKGELVKKLLEMAALFQEEGTWTAALSKTFLEIALICEESGDFVMANVAATRAVNVKRDCHGEDHPGFKKYAEVSERIKGKIG